MTFLLRQLSEQDVRQLVEIEKEAFPTLWPRTPFKKDITNRRISYLVVTRPLSQSELDPDSTHPSPDSSRFIIPRLLMRAFNWQSPPDTSFPHPIDVLLGYVGTWFLTDEAHITAIAVSEQWQGQGLGELLLIGAIEESIRRASRMVTLEARISNYKALSLYNKYGFVRTGTRKGYYSDNREDAAIMETDPISGSLFQSRFKQLKESFFSHHDTMKSV